MDLFHSQAFGFYALFVSALFLILASVDMFGGLILPRSKAAPLPPAPVANGQVERANPQGHARVMAAHRNAMASIIPFTLMMLLYVLLGGDKTWVTVLCGVYTAMRLAHAVTHIRHIQPWRTVVWIVGQFCFFITMFQVVQIAIQVVST